MSKLKTAIYDVDDSLFFFTPYLCEFHHRLTGQYFNPEDLTEWALPKELMDSFYKYENFIYASQPVIDNVRIQLELMKERGFHIILMTARDVKFKEATLFNLTRNNIKFDEVLFNKNKALKINRLSEDYDVILFADDKLSTVNAVKRDTNVPHVFLINMPSNKAGKVEEGVIRINNIYDISKEIK